LKENAFYYFDDDKCMHPKGMIPLIRGISIAKEGKTEGKYHYFHVTSQPSDSSSRVYTVYTESREERQLWLDALNFVLTPQQYISQGPYPYATAPPPQSFKAPYPQQPYAQQPYPQQPYAQQPYTPQPYTPQPYPQQQDQVVYTPSAPPM
jgi:hypothetical protein